MCLRYIVHHTLLDGLLTKSLFYSIFPRMRTRQRIDTAPNEPSAVFALFAHLGQAFASPSFCDSKFHMACSAC